VLDDEGSNAMQIGCPAKAQNFFDVTPDLRASGKRASKMLLVGQEGRPDNYRLSYDPGGNTEAWQTPRHRHNFEQIRHPLRGELIIGHKTVVPEGWVSYFPESCYYGPQVRNPDLSMILLQFGGPSGYGYDSGRATRAGMEALIEKGGEFKNGMYSWVDASGKRRNQDAAEAVYEEIHGHEIVYPEPRYDRLLMFNPAAYPWIAEKGQPGVFHKWMGTFSEREIRFGFIRVEAGAALRLGTAPSSEVLFLKSGLLSYKGEPHGMFSAFATDGPAAAESLTAIESAELFYVKLPTF